jgi:hypothetical protein
VETLKRQRSLHGDEHFASTLQRAKELTTIYEALRIWAYTARDACLLDSLMLADFLRRQQIPAHLLIGVATKPFSAHAWVQLDNFVLNDTVERVQGFTPILATNGG